MENLNIIQISSCNDPRLAPYQNLRERTLRGESAFIAEGHLVSERLLDSPFRTLSLLISEESIPALSPELRKKIGNIPLYAVPEKEMISQIAGFHFHQGMMALGERKPLPNFIEAVEAYGSKPAVWVVLPNATKPENLGLVFRSAAALGASGVVLGERCCDPFSRRALRVSMGGVLQVPVIQSQNLRREIAFLKETTGISFCATLLAPDALSLREYRERPKQTAILFGNEYSGLDPEDADLCNLKLTIPMAEHVDSLNLGVSVGIFLYEFRPSPRQAISDFL